VVRRTPGRSDKIDGRLRPPRTDTTPLKPPSRVHLPAEVSALLPRLFATTLAALAVAAVAHAEVDPAAAAEGWVLARLVLFGLTPLALVRPLDQRTLGIVSALLAAVPWLLPAGPARGAVLQLGLAAAVAWAGVLFVTRPPVDTPRERRAAALGWVGLALAAQATLLGANELIAPLDPAATARLLVLPLVGAGLLALLAQRHHPTGLLTASAAALLLAPGWNLTLLTTLATFVAVSQLLPSEGHASPRLGRLAGGLLLLALAAARPDTALLAGVAAAIGNWPRRGSTTPQPPVLPRLLLAPGLAFGLLLVASRWPLLSVPGAVLPSPAWILVLFPAAWLAARQPLRTAAGLALGIAATAFLREEAALSASCLLLGLLGAPTTTALARPEEHWNRRLLAVQAASLTAAWLGVATLAGYPWLREQPLDELVARLTLAPALSDQQLSPLAAAGHLALAGGLAATPLPAALVPALPALVELVDRGERQPQPIPLPGGMVVLTAEQPTVELALARPLPPGRLYLESHATNLATLAEGTPVASIDAAAAASGGSEGLLRVGLETADWAAARPGAEQALAPVAWSWVPAGGGFYAHRYRAEIGFAGADRTLVLRRAPGLPADVALAISRLEWQR
jgi:hypothetical protein